MTFYREIETKCEILKNCNFSNLNRSLLKKLKILLYCCSLFWVIHMDLKSVNDQLFYSWTIWSFWQNCDSFHLYIVLFGINFLIIAIGIDSNLNFSVFFNFTILFQFLVEIWLYSNCLMWVTVDLQFLYTSDVILKFHRINLRW